jgi:hypothetical protein
MAKPESFFETFAASFAKSLPDKIEGPPNLTNEAKALAKIEDVPVLCEIAARGWDRAENGTEEGRNALEAAAWAIKPWAEHHGLARECASVFANHQVIKWSPMPKMMNHAMATGAEAARRARAIGKFLERVIPVVQQELNAKEAKS